jgi:hypothetical protein
MRLAQSKGMKVASAASLKTQLSRWENGHVTPGYYQDLLCDFYNMMPSELGIGAEAPAASPSPDEGGRIELIDNPEWLRTLDRLDQDAGWEPGAARRQVEARLAALDGAALHDRATSRRRISQHSIAQALRSYYFDSGGSEVTCYGQYSAQVGPDVEIMTSVLTHPGWLDLDCPLATASDGLRLTSQPRSSDLPTDASLATAAATQRLAEMFAVGGRLTDMPLYRLLDLDIGPGHIAGSVAVMPFVRYAVTMDLLERELIDALATGMTPRPGTLPLRDRYLPDLRSVLAVGERVCAGGALALCAIARPASPHRGPDYALLVQERSDQVINAAGRVAVIPKGFHQPMTDFRADAQIAATLLREMEEELFGREDIDNTRAGAQHAVDPMHPERLSKPMRWLTGEPGRLRIECTGFGLNLVSGNFEFACLIVIDSEEFWSRYGGDIEANWESSSIRLYSSLDDESITELASHAEWSNEGLFAFLQGLRRLRNCPDRVNIPTINC